MIKGRRRAALALCLLWVAVATVSFFLSSEMYGQDWDKIGMVVSPPLMIVGLIMFFGEIRLTVPYIFYSKEELSKSYDVEKISFVLGITVIGTSYPFIFAHMYSFALTWIIIGAVLILIEFMAIYTAVAKRFKANTQSK